MEPTNLTNHFLIAMPGLPDINFHHSVSYICEHNEHGAIGIMINRPMDIPLSEVFKQLNIAYQDDTIKELPIYYGGPVHQQRGFVIHTHTKTQWRSSIQTSESLMVTTSQDILEAVAVGEGPEQFIVALGYAGWGAQQLEQELGENSWLNCESDINILFNMPYTDRWEAAAKLIGIDIKSLSGNAGHA